MPEQPRPRVPSHPHPPTAPNRRAPAPQPHQPPVRRNLFQSQLTRRPTPGAPPAGGGAGAGAEALRLEGCVDVLSDSDEIVVRDKKGEVEVEGPGFVEGDEGVDEREEMESKFGTSSPSFPKREGNPDLRWVVGC